MRNKKLFCPNQQAKQGYKTDNNFLENCIDWLFVYSTVYLMWLQLQKTGCASYQIGVPVFAFFVKKIHGGKTEFRHHFL